ncbi:translation initiation factor IF-2 [Parvibaculum sp.]|jgi:translation initiation factor IF-2|uniref:translation initiation factor IF-2 n=1 Tax=Parvibaculum sp. TaxID=2024848 RepID=UPI000C37B2BD|nr:translation initiation factor IF-2 [Parvibaculum sp.]MAM95811.1 translation initiation factor IF-2 [Parvibaculum sp.]|tara:strand:+ start:25724 stop:28369 length:2646 start_codon:yes stop_codon:yes gene_type:complete
MTDQADTSERKPKAGGKTLSLKRTVESGHVRQNFSHGRSKSVVVEKKKKRTLKAGTEAAPAPAEEKAKAAPAPAPAEPAPVEAKKPAAPEAAKPAPTPAPAAARAPAAAAAEKKPARARSGVVLRTLTEEEKNARAQALDSAREREDEDRRRAEEEARRFAEEDARRERERAAAAARAAEEAARLAAEQEARSRSAEDAKRRSSPDEPVAAPARPSGKELTTEEADEDSKPKRSAGHAAPKQPATRRNEERRRGKLTITKAFDDDSGRQRSLASMRRRVERERKKHMGVQEAPQKITREVVIPEVITIQELANRMAERAVDVMKILMKQGIMLKITDVIDSDTAQLVAEELGHTVKRVAESDVEEGLVGEDDAAEMKKPRAPVVTVMGHVDHGKTSLLDALRKTDVAAGEAGGITQHIGAYQVELGSGDRITFLDTPGHAAFTSMRARGAKVTDIVVLVVAADDGVMPQTIEAINHAKAAGVPMIVAINKMDKPESDPSRVKNELLQHEVVVEDFGGDVMSVEISAKNGMGLDKLEEAILLQAEVLEVTANPDRAAEGIIVEAKLDRGRGPVGTVLVQRGTLNVGDIIVAGTEWGRVRALINDRGENVPSAGPSQPVEVLGLGGAPEAGDVMSVVESEGRAREITDYRQRVQRDKRVGTGGRASLDQMLSQLKEQDRKELPVIVKADVQGSAEAIVQALEKLGTDEVTARVIHVGAGGVTESDVTLATASNAPIIGFNVRANAQARDAARQAGIEIRYYSVIYDLVDDIKAALSGMLSPELRETFLGNAEILEIFNISKTGKVAGCRVTEGVVRRGSHVRLIRDDVVIHEGKLSTLKRFKDEVKEVQSGQECGMAFENYQDMRKGDVIECFDVEVVKRTLD